MAERLTTFDKHRNENLDLISKGYSFGDLTGDDTGSSGLWDEEIKAFIEASNLKGLFFSEDWVYITLNLRAELISNSPMIIKREVTQEGGKVIEEDVDSHPVLTILDMPNPFQEYSSFMYNYVVELDLMGNAIVFFGRARQNLVIIPADSVSLKFDDKKRLNAYSIVATDSADFSEVDNLLNLKDDQMAVSAKNVWHQRRPNPASVLWGLSPFIPNRKSILFNRYTQDWLNSFYLKGATPTMALSMDRNANDDAATRLLRSFEMAYTGRRNMRRPLLLPKGVAVSSISPTIADQQLLDLVRVNREQILAILGIPKHAVSLAESGSLGSEEHKQALKFLYTGSILPTQKKIAAFFTRKFKNAGLLEETERLEFDNSEVEVLREDMIRKAELSDKLKAVWTVNEIRERIWDMEPKDGHDDIEGKPLQASQTPFPFSLSDHTPVVEKQAQSKEDEPDHNREYRDNVVKAVCEKYQDNISARLKQNISIIEDQSKKIKDFWEKAGKSFAEEAVSIIRQELKKGEPQEKAVDDDESPKKIPSRASLKRKLERLYDQSTGVKTDVTDWSEEKWLETFVKDFNDVANESYDIQVAPIVNADNREAFEAVKARNEDGRRVTLEERGLESHRVIGDTTIDRILNSVERGISERKTIQEIGADIAKASSLSPKRAEFIARQESLTAVTIGKIAATDDAKGLFEDNSLLKVWINLGDNRVRGNPGGLYPDAEADHWSIQGETQELKDNFSNGLKYPRDPKSGDLSNVMGCRCDFLLVPRDDLEALVP